LNPLVAGFFSSLPPHRPPPKKKQQKITLLDEEKETITISLQLKDQNSASIFNTPMESHGFFFGR